MPKKERAYPDITDAEKQQLAKQRKKSGLIDFLYNARHDLKHAFIYDPCKAIISGFKKLWGLRPWKKQPNPVDPPTAEVDISTLSAKQKENLKINASVTTGTHKITLGDRKPKQIGGTKTMMSYTGEDNSKWLMKRAEDSVGRTKQSGALLTEAGYKLQKIIDPATAVEAFASKTKEDGIVSFQREVPNVVKTDGTDLFYFSRHHTRMHQKEFKDIEGMGDQILREHVTDWLLCNFDTKGENFLVTEPNPGSGKYTLHGIDKENAFKKILSDGAQHMSSTYKPHNYDTLYNGVFSEYAKGRINLNLTTMKNKVNEIVSMNDEDYMKTFSVYLDNVRKKDPSKYAQTYTNILKRKNELGREYNRFFGELVRERCNNVTPEEADRLRNEYLPNGKFTAFREKTVTPESIGKEKTIRLREEGFAQILSADPKVRAAGVNKILFSQHMKKDIEAANVPKNADYEKEINKQFSPEVFERQYAWFTANPVTKNLVKDVANGKFRLQDLSSSDSVLRALAKGFNDYKEQLNKEQKQQPTARQNTTGTVQNQKKTALV